MRAEVNIKTLQLSQINPAPYNPRVALTPGDPEYEKLKKSVLAFGYVDPMVWNERTGSLVGGHQRFRILQDAGYTEFDVSVVSLGVHEEKALNVALNKIEGRWDNALLAQVLADLEADGFDATLTGFDGADLDILLANMRAGDGLDGLGFGEDEQGGGEDEPGTGRGLGNPIIKTEIVFDTEDQQAEWQKFVRWLKANVEGDTIGARLDKFLRKQELGEEGFFFGD